MPGRARRPLALGRPLPALLPRLSARPGQPTAKFLDFIMTRLTLAGEVALVKEIRSGMVAILGEPKQFFNRAFRRRLP